MEHPEAATTYHTPAEFAAKLRTKLDRVYALIASGELHAVNIATSRTGRPRWRIPEEAVRQFESSRQSVQPTPPQRRRRKRVAVKQYF